MNRSTRIRLVVVGVAGVLALICSYAIPVLLVYRVQDWLMSSGDVTEKISAINKLSSQILAIQICCWVIEALAAIYIMASWAVWFIGPSKQAKNLIA